MQSYRVTVAHTPFPGPLDVQVVGLKARNCEHAQQLAAQVTGAVVVIGAWRKADEPAGPACLLEQAA